MPFNLIIIQEKNKINLPKANCLQKNPTHFSAIFHPTTSFFFQAYTLTLSQVKQNRQKKKKEKKEKKRKEK
jgi:hypothetical protein